jgi:tetratricopeptide (TPR) repeat protein
MRPLGPVLGITLGLVCSATLAAARPVVVPPAPADSPNEKDAAPAARSEPADPAFEKLTQTAEAARTAGQYDEAVRLYREALDSDPSWTEGRWALGTTLYTLERFGEAREAFQAVVAAEPEHAASWSFKGLCEFELGDYEKAFTDLQKAQALNFGPRDIATVATYHLAILLTRYEQYEMGLEKLAELARQGYESPSLIEALGLAALRLPYLPSEMPPEKREMLLMAGRAMNHWANSRMTAARRGFEELLLRYPEQPNIHYTFGVFLLLEDQDAALEQFEHELRLSPYHVEAMLQIAIEKNMRAENEAALPLAEKAVELAPTLPAARNVLGRILFGMGDMDRAIQVLEQGVKLAPDHRQLHFELARAYARAGRKEDAERERAIFAKLEQAERARVRDRTLAGAGPQGEAEPRE